MTRLTSLAFFFLLFVLLGTAPVFAQNTVFLPQNASVVSLKQNFPYFRDKTNAESFHQAHAYFNLHSQNTPPTAQTLNFGTEGSIYWFKLSLNNQSQNNEWHFSLTSPLSGLSPMVKRLHVYDDRKNGETLYSFGDTAPSPEATRLNSPYFPITLSSGEERNLLIMLETMEKVPFSVQPSMVSAPVFEKQQNTQIFSTIGILAIATILSSIALTLYFISGLGALLIYAFYIPVMLGTSILFSGGYIGITPYLSTSLINTILIILPGLTAGLSLFLGREVFELKTGKKLFNLLGALLSLGAIGFSVAVAFLPDLSNLFVKANLMLPAYAAALLAVLSLLYSFGSQLLLIFGLSWIPLVVAAVTPTLSNAQGLFLHGLLLSLYMFVYIRQKAKQARAKDDEMRQDFDSKIRAIKVETETEKQALQRRRESEKNMLQDLRQRDAVRAHELKVAKAEADRANEAKSDFLAMISHEIRTPMTGIMGMVQLTLESNLNTQQREYVETIKYSGETLLALLNDILDFSKIESGHMDLENVHFDLHRLIHSVTMLMSGRANEQGLTLKTTIPDDVPALLQGDPNRIRQILLNLLGNAIKFTKKGSVTIAVDNKGEKDGIVDLHFSIIDTGIGISQSAQEKLFAAYQQADESISRRYGGTGLGLNICKMLTEAMGGKISVKSTQGKGSTFTFNLPLRLGKEQQLNTQDETPNETARSSVSPLKILSIDDNEINLKVLSGLLEKDGHDVTISTSGKEALELIKDKSFDIILADMRMPQMSGLDFSRTVRNLEDKNLSKLPIIAMTGNTQQKDVEECRAAGMNGFLSKPPSLEALRAAIEKVLLEKDNIPSIVEKPAIRQEKPILPAPTQEEEKKIEIEQEPKIEVETKQTPPAVDVENIKKPQEDNTEEKRKETPAITVKKEKKKLQTDSAKKALSATAEMAETVMGKMAQSVEKTTETIMAATSKKPPEDEKDSETIPTEKPQKNKDIKKMSKEKSSADKDKLNEKINDLKAEATSFYKKAKASVMLGLGKEKEIEAEDFEEIAPDLEEDIQDQEELAEVEIGDEAYSLDEIDALEEGGTSGEEDDNEENDEEEKKSLEEMTDEAGKSVELLNTAMIEDLQNSLGIEALDGLFNDLFVKAEEILAATKEAAKDSDFDDVGERGHELKGMCANFGLDRLATLGDAFEKAGMKRSKERVTFLVPLFKPMLEETKTALDTWRSKQK